MNAMDNLQQYVWLLAVVVVAFLIVKRVASCALRMVVLALAAALLAYTYYMYLNP